MYYRSKKKQPMHNMDNVLGFVVRVFNDQGNMVVKAPAWGEQVAKEDQGKSNKEKVLALLESGTKPSKEEIDEGRKMASQLQGKVVLNELSGVRTNDFMANVNTNSQGDEIEQRGIGIVVWLPKVAKDLDTAEKEQETMQVSGSTSEFIGKVKDKLTLDIVPIKVRKVVSIGKFSVTGTVDGNLVTFWHSDEPEVGKQMTVSARVKEHKQCQYHFQNNVTQLHYVKVA